MMDLPSLGPCGEGWVVIQVVLLGAIGLSGWWFGPDWSGPLRLAGIVGGIMGIAGGAILVVRGILDLGRSLTPNPRPRDDATLVETGVYARARHPIYGGLILIAVGWAVMQASLVALVASTALAAFLGLKSMREEAWLVVQFPEYAAYRTRTKRFIPWIG